MAAGTCGAMCWYAREEACHCQCGGINHGLLRNSAGVEQPVRTRRIKDQIYELDSVQINYSAAYKRGRELGQEWTYDFVAHTSKHNWLLQAASGAQLKWPETAGFVNTGFDRPYLIWVPKEN